MKSVLLFFALVLSSLSLLAPVAEAMTDAPDYQYRPRHRHVLPDPNWERRGWNEDSCADEFRSPFLDPQCQQYDYRERERRRRDLNDQLNGPRYGDRGCVRWADGSLRCHGRRHRPHDPRRDDRYHEDVFECRDERGGVNCRSQRGEEWNCRHFAAGVDCRP